MNIQSLYDQFLTSRRLGTGTAKRKSTPRTLEFYQRHMKFFLDFMAERGVIGWAELTKSQVMAYIEWLGAKEASGDWKRATVLQNLRTLRAFFRYIREDEDLSDEGIKAERHLKWLPAIEEAPFAEEIPSLNTFRQFKNSFHMSSIIESRDYTMIAVMAATGIRIGEVCNIELGDLEDLDGRTVIVQGKRGRRTITLADDLVRLLKAWIRKRAQLKPAKDSPFLFVSKKSPRVSPTAWASHIARFRQKHNLPRITAHSFRHAFCVNWLAEGGDIEALRKMTGHKDYQVLLRYTKHSEFRAGTMKGKVNKYNLLKHI